MAARRKRPSKLDPHVDKLGVLPDATVAELAGVTVSNVRAYRKRHGIAAAPRGKALAAAPDAPAPVVSTKRARPRRSKLDPYREKVGAVPDREVAELAGVSAENVRAFRKRRGIPAAWRGEGQEQPAVAAVKPSAKPRRVSRPRRSKLDPFMDKVGVVPDREVAVLAGVSAENVRAFRKRRGIPAGWRDGGSAPVATPTPALEDSVAPKKAGRTRRGKLTPYRELVGVLSDSKVAKMAGTAAQNVRAFRLRHDIPARWRGEGQPLPNEEAILTLHVGPQAAAPAPAPVPAPEPVIEAVVAPVVYRGREGYVVTVQGSEEEISYVVVAHDIAEAAAKAVRGVERRGIAGRLLSVRFLARALGS